MRFSNFSNIRAFSSSRLALMLSLAMILLSVVASAAFATPVMPPIIPSNADLPATEGRFQHVVLHLSANADIKVIRRALVDLSKKGLVRHIEGDAYALHLEATPDALPELKKIEGVGDVTFESRSATDGPPPSQVQDAEFKTYWLTISESSKTKAWAYVQNSLSRWQADGHVSHVERVSKKTIRVLIKADAVALLDALPDTVEVSKMSSEARLSFGSRSPRMPHTTSQGQITSQPYWLTLKPASLKGGASAALLKELGNLQVQGLVQQFERSVQDNTLRVIALSTAEASLKQLPSVLNVTKSAPSASEASRAASGGGEITGTVDAPDGTPLADIYVMVDRYNPQNGYWEWVNKTLTGADGQYNLSGLQTGTYRICFLNSTSLTPYLDECYDDASFFEGEMPTDISVTEGEITAGIDATLNEGGHITGTLTDQNGNPLPDLEVIAFHDEWGGESYAHTDENGHYDVAGLYAGHYKVCFMMWNNPYLDECYDDMPDWESATLVPVTVGETTAGIDAVLNEGGHITGTVTDSDGNPIAGVEASTRWYNPEGGWQWGNYAHTNENGEYDIAGLYDGIHRVCFHPNWDTPYLYECYDNAVEWDNLTDITVTAQETITGIDAVLSDGGHITGTVTDSADNALSEIEVVVFQYFWDEVEQWGYWAWLNSVYTDGNGQYDLASLQTDTYRICFFDWNGAYLDECYDDAPYIEEATDIELIVEETIAGIDAVLSEGGHITGTITDAAGNPISGVEVVAHSYTPWGDWEGQNPAYTDANGQYDVAHLQTGTYRVCFSDSIYGYLEECYDDVPTLESAMDMTLTADETIAGIDAVLSESGHITGTVTDTAGNPIEGVEVVAYWYHPEWNQWWWSYSGFTDVNGQYDVAGLQTGTYHVGFFDWEQERYVEQYYDDAAMLESATDIAVTAGETTAGIDAVLSEGGHITGTVTDPDGNPVSGVQVVAHWYLADVNEWVWMFHEFTDANGQYDIGNLQTATYRVGFFDWEGGYVEQYYDNAPTIEDGTDIAVTVEETTAGIDAVLSEGGHMTGTITDSDGNPLPYINVEVYRYFPQWDSWHYAGGAYTNQTGSYDVPELQSGDYRVSFSAWNSPYLPEYYDNASTLENATDVEVILDQTTNGIDAVLEEGGHITGTVTDPDGNPLQGVHVEAYDYNQLYNDWESAASAYTDGNGQYNLLGLQAGNYRVGFDDSQERYPSEYYDDAAEIENATDISVTAGETTPNIDASLNNGGHITGTVTDAAGNPLPDIGIEVYRYNSVEQDWEWTNSAYTDFNGQYNVPNVQTGNYRLGFFAWYGQYLSEYYDNAPTVESGTDIEVIAGETTADIDAALNQGGHITGRVTDAEDNPLYGIDVEVYSLNSETLSWEWAAYGYTSFNGTYDVAGLHTGTYRVGFMDWNQGYAREYYDNATELEGATDIAVTVSESTSGIDASLEMGGRLEGTVTTSDGTPVVNIDIEVYRLTPNAEWELVDWGYTAIGGNYIIGGLRSGTYRLGFFDWNAHYFTKYYADATDLNSATDIALLAGETISDLDVTLQEGAYITGQVTSETATLRGDGENGLPNIQVEAYRYNGSHWEAVGFGITDSNGNYDIAGLASGAYRIGFFEPFGLYAYEYYSNASNLATASEVIVIAGETTANINASLADAADAIAQATSASGSVISDPQTGQITIIQPSWNLTNITITLVASCSDGSTPSEVTLLVAENSDSMSATDNENEYSATIPAADIEDGAQISLTYLCNGNFETQAIGQIQILQDPSGYITDAETGEAIADAKVTLYNVPGWRARSSAVEENERTPNTCQSNLSKAASEPWSQEAPTELGVLATGDESQIDPAINPIMTAPDGFYGWNVANGCWYVIVEADGYQRLVSPVVGVPPEVTDLDLALTPSNISTVSFNQSEIEVPESIETAVISITLATVPTQTVSVDYTTLNDTATAGSDYTTATGTLTFLPGETRGSINITILDDERREASETLLILLSNPINSSLGVNKQVQLTIIDNEPLLDHHIYLPLMNGSSD